jgi:hypothetical protein
MWQGLERAALTSVACHPTQAHLVAFACTDGKVGLYDLEARHVIAQCNAHKRVVRSLDWRHLAHTSFTIVPTDDHDHDDALLVDVNNSSAATYALYSFAEDGMLMSHRTCCSAIDSIESRPQQQQQKQQCVNVTETYFGTKTNELSIVAWNADGRLLAGAYSAGLFYFYFPTKRITLQKVFSLCLGFLSVLLLNSDEIEQSSNNDDRVLRRHTTSIDSVAHSLRWLDSDRVDANDVDMVESRALLACGCVNGSIVVFAITVDAITTLCVLQGKQQK